MATLISLPVEIIEIIYGYSSNQHLLFASQRLLLYSNAFSIRNRYRLVVACISDPRLIYPREDYSHRNLGALLTQEWLTYSFLISALQDFVREKTLEFIHEKWVQISVHHFWKDPQATKYRIGVHNRAYFHTALKRCNVKPKLTPERAEEVWQTEMLPVLLKAFTDRPDQNQIRDGRWRVTITFANGRRFQEFYSYLDPPYPTSLEQMLKTRGGFDLQMQVGFCTPAGFYQNPSAVLHDCWSSRTPGSTRFVERIGNLAVFPEKLLKAPPSTDRDNLLKFLVARCLPDGVRPDLRTLQLPRPSQRRAAPNGLLGLLGENPEFARSTETDLEDDAALESLFQESA